MLNKATTLKGYTLLSLDGEIGRVKEFYFDDRHWTIRYLVADTGNWLTGRQVLISPHALISVMSGTQSIAVNLTKQQIEDSPALKHDEPVSRQYEANYYGYYKYPIYWNGSPTCLGNPYVWVASRDPSIIPDAVQGLEATEGVISPYGLGESSSVIPPPEPSSVFARKANTGDAHLRSTQAVSGYHIEAEDGPIGHVEDFIIDDETWAIRYLIVDTVNWWPGKKVLVAARWIERVSWGESKVFINLSRAAIKQAPEYKEESLLTRDYESRLHGHYNRQGYWIDEHRNVG